MTPHTKLATANVHIAPTLHTMADIYALTREGGPKSPRFLAYVSQTENNWGMVPYNPMAGDAALETVNALIALDAEALAERAAVQAANACHYADAITLAISVRSKGLWTDRIATEVDERVTGKARVAHRGVISIWSREDSSALDVAREAAAEAVRVMWHAQHGVADTLNRVLACEGLAYAIAEPIGGLGPYATELTPEETVAVIEAFEVLGDTTQAGEIAGVIYGDDAAAQIGWTPLGISKFAGYRWAIARARAHVASVGARAALATGASSN
ncbi:MAG: hypothetical protein ABI852_01850 [Gemmatimonadaceae bacterium]